MYRRLIIAAFLGTAAFFTAHLINLMVAHALTKSVGMPDAPAVPDGRLVSQVDRRRLAEEILAGGIFASYQGSSRLSGFGTTVSGMGGSAPQVPPIDAAKKIKLIGTVVGDRTINLAVLEEIASKKQTLYHLHELVPAVGEIVDIRKEAILIRQGTQQEILPLTAALPPRPAAPPGVAAPVAEGGLAGASLSRVLDRREVAQSIADLPRLLSQARATAFYVNGKQEGWRLESLASQSFYERIGLRSGDVLQRINGTELRDPGMLLAFFQQLKDERSVSLDMLRDERKTTISYDIR